MKTNSEDNMLSDDKNSANIKESFTKGTYFKEAESWFYEKYLSSYNIRFKLLIIITFFVVFIFTMLFMAVSSILGAKAMNGIISLESSYDEKIVMQKIPKFYSNNEKNILRFVAEHYINFFESYNHDKFSIYNLDAQINEIKKFSTRTVGEKFEKIARNNYTSEIFNGFNRNSKITSFEFVEDNLSMVTKLLNYILPEKTPTKIKVNLSSYLYKDNSQILVKEEKRVVELTFKYKPLERDANGNFGDLEFIVTSYNYLSV